ncbi:MAG: hypothetical protein EXR73_01755 [Myxococcales bacterium]|nr:hypothetical protein [Myxococcales bacterium]
MKPLRVLVVDDSPDDCELLLRRLRKEGYAPEHVRVDTADDLRAALAHDEDLACLIVSGTIGEDLAVAALHAGGGAVTLEARAFLAMTKNAVLEKPFAPPAGRSLVNSLVE